MISITEVRRDKFKNKVFTNCSHYHGGDRVCIAVARVVRGVTNSSAFFVRVRAYDDDDDISDDDNNNDDSDSDNDDDDDSRVARQGVPK